MRIAQLWQYLRKEATEVYVCYELVSLCKLWGNNRPQCLLTLSQFFFKLWNILLFKPLDFSSSCSWKGFCFNENDFISKTKCCSGCFSFYDILQQFQHAFFSLQWDQQGLQHKVFWYTFHCWKWARFQKHLTHWSHYLSFSKFLQQQIQGYSLWSVSHIFHPSTILNPVWPPQPTSHPASSTEMITAVLGRPPLVDNQSLTPGWNACDARTWDPVKLTSQSLHPDCHWLNRGNEDVLWNAMEWANKLHIKSS